jgi:2-keto-4-pentenoate hydratase/2-oxohepta-3-ene-1,7-dioic acid hydratase in catechol pathway
MIFGVAEYIAAISEYITLRPGDVVWTGTDNATDRIAPGDVVEISVAGIGTLRNPVVGEPGCAPTNDRRVTDHD